jgi:hypothetical protein
MGYGFLEALMAVIAANPKLVSDGLTAGVCAARHTAAAVRDFGGRVRTVRRNSLLNGDLDLIDKVGCLRSSGNLDAEDHTELTALMMESIRSQFSPVQRTNAEHRRKQKGRMSASRGKTGKKKGRKESAC